MSQFAIGFVLYHPNIEKLERTLKKFSRYTNEVVLFNNGTSEEELHQLKANHWTVIGDGVNVGIATALNKIMEYTQYNFKADWVIVSDQDADYRGDIFTEYSKLIDIDNIGAICPQIIKSIDQEKLTLENRIVDVKRCPTSGMAMKVSDWLSVGKYDDDLFIDYVDYDMCEKILLNHKKIIRTYNVALVQSLGNAKQIKWIYRLGKLLKSNRIEKMALIFNHSPKRNYYFVRNSIIYLERYKGNIDKKRELFFIIKWELKKLLFEKNKMAQMRAIRHGLIDGLKLKGRSQRG